MNRSLLAARAVVAALALTLALALVAACSSAEPPRSSAADPVPVTPSPTPIQARPAPELTCGRGVMSWPVEAMDGGIDGEVGTEIVRAALVDLVERAGIDAPIALQDVPIDDAPWFVLAEDRARIAVATGPWTATGPGESGQIVYLEPEGGAWRANGWGDCRRLSPVLDPGEEWVRIYQVAVADPLSTRLTATVGEVECTGARDPRPYLLEPRIVETDDTVVVTWTSKAVVGGATCPGNPSVSQPLQLTSPLGDRVVRDGSTYPARKVPVRSYQDQLPGE